MNRNQAAVELVTLPSILQLSQIGLGREILNNHGSHYVRSRDRHIFYQDECRDNYIGVCRKIERHSLVDTEHQENQWAL